MQSSQSFLRKDKEKEMSELSKNFEESSTDSSQNLTESFENISLSERTRNEISKEILQKLRNRHSKTFTNHRKSSHFIISFSSSEADMIEQQQQNRSNQNIQNMIQIVIREMMSKIIQQSVATTMNVIVATARSDSSFSSAELSQMISRATSKSRIDK
jgi:hypothetical protein